MSNGVRLVYEEVERLRCVFNAIVIKNSALNEKYPGGLRAYLDKHGGRCNRMITAESFMGGEINEIFNDLRKHGFKHKLDFLFVDAGGYALLRGMGVGGILLPEPVDLGVDWLEG